jgi:hypothetical protein
MNTNTILDDAEARAKGAGHTREHEASAMVDQLREFIGHQWYTQAKAALPSIEKDIQAIYRPFADRLLALTQQTRQPAPDDLRRWLQELSRLFDAPRAIREGLTAFDTLSVDMVRHVDGHSIDINKQAQVVTSTRMLLKSADGLPQALAGIKGQVETCLRDSGWPSA